MSTPWDDRHDAGPLQLLGLLSAMLLIGAALLGAWLFVQSLPEVRRYLRMKKM
jgi:hypothetical protein